MLIHDPRHTKCSNFTEARWVKFTCNHENNVPSQLSPKLSPSYHVPKCMSCHKVIVVITGRAHCFHDWIYMYIYIYVYIYIYICICIYMKYMRVLFSEKKDLHLVSKGVEWRNQNKFHAFKPDNVCIKSNRKVSSTAEIGA